MGTYGQPDRKLVININKYLIDKYPTLNLRARNAIGALVEKADINLSSVHKQIDKITKDYVSSIDQGTDNAEEDAT
tara:strand:- start:12610 stop:12837 length:228 start_codon:yes stop_codon:yes gene_type:complete